MRSREETEDAEGVWRKFIDKALKTDAKRKLGYPFFVLPIMIHTFITSDYLNYLRYQLCI